MKVKKILKKQAAADHKKILDANQEFFQTLIARNYPKQKTDEPKQYFNLIKRCSLIAGCAIVCIVTVLLLVFLPMTNSNDGQNGKKEYFQENMVYQQILLPELNDALTNFSFMVVNQHQDKILRYYDSPSNDTLFYKITGINEEKFEEWIIEIELNEFYVLTYEKDNYVKSVNISGYKVYYYSENYQEDGIHFLTSYAYINIGSETLCIEYHRVSFEVDESLFLDWIGEKVSKLS